MKYTPKQAQYIAFIYYYTKINKIPPAERDIQVYFNVSSASVHQMIKNLKQKDLITSIPGKPRTLTVNLAPECVPTLI